MEASMMAKRSNAVIAVGAPHFMAFSDFEYWFRWSVRLDGRFLKKYYRTIR